jgi:phage shock protein C
MNKEIVATIEKKLFRSETNKMLAGVAGGIAEYFDIDPALVRLLFVLATFFGGSGIPIYIILWIILPSAKGGTIASEATVKENFSEMKNKAKEMTNGMSSKSSTGRGRVIIATVLIGFGALTLLDNFKIFNTHVFWPLLLILIGFLLLRRQDD